MKMDLDKKLAVLAGIAHKFNDKQVTWAIGASALLYFRGVAEAFADIDIVIAESDVDSVKEILAACGTQQASPPNVQYQTKVFLEYVIEGVGVDIMAGFTVVKDGVAHYFPLEKKKITEHITVGGAAIPLQSLEEWKLYYALMGRTEKVVLIERKQKEKQE